MNDSFSDELDGLVPRREAVRFRVRAQQAERELDELRKRLEREPTPDHSAYIGKTLADVPDGTVAVWARPSGAAFLAIKGDGRLAAAAHEDGAWRPRGLNYLNDDQAIALHIIKLGEPKPTTLAEMVLEWRDARSNVYSHHPGSTPHLEAQAKERQLRSAMTERAKQEQQPPA